MVSTSPLNSRVLSVVTPAKAALSLNPSALHVSKAPSLATCIRIRALILALMALSSWIMKKPIVLSV